MHDAVSVTLAPRWIGLGADGVIVHEATVTVMLALAVVLPPALEMVTP